MEIKTIAETATMAVWGLWTAFCAFITPFCLSIGLIGMTGQMEKYDWSLHEGDGGGLIGFLMLAFWGLIAAFPGVSFLKRLRAYGKKIFTVGCLCLAVILVVGIGVLVLFW